MHIEQEMEIHGETVYVSADLEIEVTGRYHRATYDSPEEWPSVELSVSDIMCNGGRPSPELAAQVEDALLSDDALYEQAVEWARDEEQDRLIAAAEQRAEERMYREWERKAINL